MWHLLFKQPDFSIPHFLPPNVQRQEYDSYLEIGPTWTGQSAWTVEYTDFMSDER